MSETHAPHSGLDAHRAGANSYRHRGHATAWWNSEPVDSPPLLLIHGFPTASYDWHLIEPDLARDHRVIRADLIGFGYSDKPRQYRYSVFDYADQLEGLLREIGVESVHVLAHDLGDTVAQELLARQQENRSGSMRLLTVSFLNGGLFPAHHRPRPIQRMLAGPLGPWLVRLLSERAFRRSFSAVFGADTQPDAQTLGECWQQIAHDGGDRIAHLQLAYIAERKLNAQRWRDALITTGTPLQLIDGPDDPVSGAHLARAFRELLPHADCVELAGIGHYPQLEAPHAVLTAYRNWRGCFG